MNKITPSSRSSHSPSALYRTLVPSPLLRTFVRIYAHFFIGSDSVVAVAMASSTE